ncbi:MAG: hypothetical protein EAZ07_07460 [Cytophagales bacterium]|nr:MAG: hypothetical protein EAZ07_07460 [Cytophagales bacterium]
MFFKKYLLKFLLLIGSFFLLNCEKEADTPDNRLIGTWSDGNVDYTFSKSMILGVKYKRDGIAQNVIKTDSIWGTYSVDNKRSNIYFNAQFYTEKANPSLIIKKDLQLPVWNYSFSNDSTLEFTSNSIRGLLRKAQ